MHKKINTTLVAAAVSMAISSTAFSHPKYEYKTSLPYYDINHDLAKKAKNNLSFGGEVHRQIKTNKGQRKTLRSRIDHFDEYLGVNTFSWSKQQADGIALNVLNRKAAIAESVKHYVGLNGPKHGVTMKSFADAKLREVHDLGRGAIISRYQQRHNGIEVHGRRLNVVMNQNMELIATTGYFAKAPSKASTVADDFTLSASKAITKAFIDMGGDSIALTPVGSKGGYDVFAANNSDKFHFIENPRAKKVYYPVGKTLVPAYALELAVSKFGSTDHIGHSYVISAKDGTLLNRMNLVDNSGFTYNVYADLEAPYRPYDGPIGNSLSPHPTGVYNDPITEPTGVLNQVTFEHVGISTNDPWLPSDATVTSGNNVIAYADLVAPDGYNEPVVDDQGNLVGDVFAEVTSANTFDYPYDPNGDVRSDDAIRAAVVNLFYVNNYLHDIYYDHGFDEIAGNAQLSNYGRGGVEGDPLLVEAQDYAGLNNANMLTLDDGASPRMQMFLFSSAQADMTLTGVDALTFEVSTSVGSGSATDFTGEVVEMFDGTEPMSDGCEAATNGSDIAGKVAFVDRGGCAFVQKALNAQAAGATAIIVANNTVDSPDDVFNMGGSDPALVIPAVMISYHSGVALRDSLRQQTVNMSLNVETVYRDGTFDNSIIQHEWGHYLSRRIGNNVYNSNQGRGMGEGWSDFTALLEVMREEDRAVAGNENFEGVYNAGGYAVALSDPTGTQGAYYFGIRRVPYTVDMTKNELTFRHIENGVPLPGDHPIAGDTSGSNNSQVHNSGEIWATALLEGYVSLLNNGGYSFDDAKARMIDYIVAGLKITPNSPTYTEARDGILAAAVANSVSDYNLLRDAFTRRGMGAGAISPDRSDDTHAGVVEDFESTINAVDIEMVTIDNQHLGSTGAYCDTDGIWDAGETNALMVQVKNIGVNAIEGLKLKISSEADVTFANNGEIMLQDMSNWFDTASGMIEMTLNNAEVGEYITINVEVMTDDETLNYINQSIELEVNRDIAKDPTRTYENFAHADSVWNDWTKEKIGAAESGNYDFLHEWQVFRPQQQDFGIGHYIWGPNGVVETDVSLISPTLQIADTGDFVTEMIHFYRFEAGNWDGGVIEVSIDGGDWIDAVAAGGQFANGYTGVVDSYNTVIGGREAYVGEIPTGYGLETLTFPEGTLNGHEVKLKFRIGTDAASGELGWLIDDIAFSNITNLAGLFSSPVEDSGVCVNRPPMAMASDLSVDEITDGSQTMVTLSVTTTDYDNDDLTYTWTQTSGEAVMLSDASAAMPTFTVPSITADTSYGFSVTVSDGTEEAMASMMVNVTDINVAPVLTGGTNVSVREGENVELSVTGTDDDGDELTYQWTVNGASSNNTTNTYNYEAPSVTSDTQVTIAVVASDGEATSNTETFTVTVENKSSSSSVGIWALLLTPLALLRRRKLGIKS